MRERPEVRCRRAELEASGANGQAWVPDSRRHLEDSEGRREVLTGCTRGPTSCDIIETPRRECDVVSHPAEEGGFAVTI